MPLQVSIVAIARDANQGVSHDTPRFGVDADVRRHTQPSPHLLHSRPTFARAAASLVQTPRDLVRLERPKTALKITRISDTNHTHTLGGKRSWVTSRSRNDSTRRLEALVEQVKKDRSILAAILCGSLSHDTVWAKSDIDLALVTIDDKKVEQETWRSTRAG